MLPTCLAADKKHRKKFFKKRKAFPHVFEVLL